MSGRNNIVLQFSKYQWICDRSHLLHDLELLDEAGLHWQDRRYKFVDGDSTIRGPHQLLKDDTMVPHDAPYGLDRLYTY